MKQIAPGTCVLVESTDGAQVKGRWAAWSDEALAVAGRGGRQTVLPRGGVHEVAVFARCRSARAALLGGLAGFAIGFGAMAIGTRSLCVSCPPERSGLLGAVGVGAALGTISALVSARSADRPARVVYRPPATSP